jgi:hypothetical protein
MSQSTSDAHVYVAGAKINAESNFAIPVDSDETHHVIVAANDLRDSNAGPSYGMTPTLTFENRLNRAIDTLCAQLQVEVTRNKGKIPQQSKLIGYSKLLVEPANTNLFAQQVGALYRKAYELVDSSEFNAEDDDLSIPKLAQLISDKVEDVRSEQYLPIFGNQFSHQNVSSGQVFTSAPVPNLDEVNYWYSPHQQHQPPVPPPGQQQQQYQPPVSPPGQYPPVPPPGQQQQQHQPKVPHPHFLQHGSAPSLSEEEIREKRLAFWGVSKSTN